MSDKANPNYEYVQQYVTFESDSLEGALQDLVGYINKSKSIPVNNGIIYFEQVSDECKWSVSLGWDFKYVKFSEI